MRKKQKYKLSFLIAAHNEERLIGKALNRLVEVHKDYPNIEVLIGLDGCDDDTPKIVQRFIEKNKFMKAIEMNERKGKQAVLDKLEPYIKGDIVIIHDADWMFVYKDKDNLIEFLQVFDNPKVGGVADSIEAEMSKPNFNKINSLGFLSSAWGNHLLMTYYKKKFTIRKENLRVYDKKIMKFCPWLDIYRKEAMDKSKHDSRLRAGDHIERTLRLMNRGYYVIGFGNKDWPHFNVSYDEQSVKDLIKQKVRGSVSKGKIGEVYDFHIPFLGFYIPFATYVLKQSFKVNRLKDFLAIYTYLFVMFYAQVVSKFKRDFSTKDVWALRNKR